MTWGSVAGEAVAQVRQLPRRGWRAVALRRGVHIVFSALAEHRTGIEGVLRPALGLPLGVLIVRRLFRETPGHGVPGVLRAVCRDGGRMRRRSVASRWLGSLVTVASGGSAGLESPIVFSGGALGAAIGGWARLDERRRSVLLACGVAGGISGIFNAPITVLVFTMEVVLAEWSAVSIVPVVLAAVSATELSRLLLGNTTSFLHAPFHMTTTDLLWCLLLGVASGLLSTALVRAIHVAERIAQRLPADATLAQALDVFERTGAWVLPVVDDTRFVGLLSKSSLFDHYRRERSVQAPA